MDTFGNSVTSTKQKKIVCSFNKQNSKNFLQDPVRAVQEMLHEVRSKTTHVKLGHKRLKVALAPPLMKSVSMKLRGVSLAAHVVD
jgi:hypothetical protein